MSNLGTENGLKGTPAVLKPYGHDFIPVSETLPTSLAGCGRIAYGAPSEACEAGKAAPGNFGTLKECRGPVLGFVGAIVVYTRMGVFACVFQRPLKRSIF